MIAGERLRAWLDDEDARARSAARVEHFGKAFRNKPELARLEAELNGVGGRSVEALEAARRFLAREETLNDLALAMIEAAREDLFFRPAFRTPLSAVHTGLIFFEHPALSLLLAVMSPDALAAKRVLGEGPTSISFGGQHAVYHFIRSGGAELSFWEAPTSGHGFVAEDNLRCRPVGRRRIADGESLTLDGRRETFVIEHATSDLVYVQALTTLESSPVMVEYDSRSLGFVGASSTDNLCSRVTMMLSLLRLMDRRDAAPLFAELLPGLPFHGRWHAMREFLALDAEAALPPLQDMAVSDPHPEVRVAAAQTLAAFFPETRTREEMPCPA